MPQTGCDAKTTLKQIGLACHNYHDSRGNFPPGNITWPKPGGGTPGILDEHGTTWSIEILPQLEQVNLYDQYNMTAMNVDPVNFPVIQSRVSAYECAADRSLGQMDVPDSGTAIAGGAKFMHGSYRAVSGRSDVTAPGWFDHSAESVMQYDWIGILHATGPPKNFQPAKFADVRDGTSHTLLVGESSFISQLNRGTFWAYSYGGYNTSSGVPSVWMLSGDYVGCGNAGVNINACKRMWGSNHGGVINFVLGDGSVRGIRKNIDVNVFTALTTMAGPVGEALDE